MLHKHLLCLRAVLPHHIVAGDFALWSWVQWQWVLSMLVWAQTDGARTYIRAPNTYTRICMYECGVSLESFLSVVCCSSSLPYTPTRYYKAYWHHTYTLIHIQIRHASKHMTVTFVETKLYCTCLHLFAFTTWFAHYSYSAALFVTQLNAALAAHHASYSLVPWRVHLKVCMFARTREKCARLVTNAHLR